MRHGDKLNNLGRKTAHRKAMLANMACSLILHKHVATTLAKAKALRVYFEPLLTKSKSDSTHSRRTLFAYLKNKEAVDMLFKEVASKIAGRPGGYTRILKTGTRLGDRADMCLIELVDFNENMLSHAPPAKAKSARRGAKKKSTPASAITDDKTAEQSSSAISQDVAPGGSADKKDDSTGETAKSE